MAGTLDLRGGNHLSNTGFVGTAREVTVDDDEHRLVVHDGATPGGFPVARKDEITGGGGGGSSFANKFLNGTMDVWQLGTTYTITTAGGWSADGWFVTPTGASCTVNRVAGRLLTEYALQIVGATSVTGVTFKHHIESLVAASLSSQVVTVQAQLLNNTGGGITPILTVKHPTSTANDFSTQTTDVSAVNMQLCPNGSWTNIAYAFNAPANAKNGLEITLDLGNNFSTSGKSVSITELDIRVTSSATVGLASGPPTPELRPVHAESIFANRYFYLAGSASGSWVDAGQFNVGISFLPAMCKVPTPIVVNGSVNGGSVVQPNVAQRVVTAVAGHVTTPLGSRLALTTTGGPANTFGLLEPSAIGFDARI